MKKICLYMLVSFLIACVKNERRDVITVDVNRRDNISIFDIFDKVEIIPLETTSESLVKDITKIVVFNDNMYILDYPMHRILIFDKKGKYVSKIDNKGNGPGEYINISDFAVKDSGLLLLSPVNRSIYEYDTNARFRNSLHLPNVTGAYQSFKILNNDTLIFWTSDNKNKVKIVTLNSNKILYECFPEEDMFFNKFLLHSVFPYNNYLTRSSSNTVYSFSNTGRIETGYIWNFGGENNDIKKIQKEMDFKTQKEMINFSKKVFSSEVVNYIFVLHGGNLLYNYTQIYRKNKPVNIFYNKISKTTMVFEKTTEGVIIFPIYWTDEYAAGLIPESENSLNSALPDAILDEQNKTIKQHINEFDNPILIKYYFKK